MARGRARRDRCRRRHHRHQHGLPGEEGDERLFRLGADARPRPCADADRGDGRRDAAAGHAEDAARLGRCDRSTRPSSPAAPKPPACGSITVHGRTRCQFYAGAADWAAIRRGEGGGLDSGHRQRRPRCAVDDLAPMLAPLRRRRRDDRPRRLWPPVVPRRPRRAMPRAGSMPRPPSTTERSRELVTRPLRGDARPLRRACSASALRAQASRLVPRSVTLSVAPAAPHGDADRERGRRSSCG